MAEDERWPAAGRSAPPGLVIRPLAAPDRPAAGAVLAAAFPDKLAALLGDKHALRRAHAGQAVDLPCGPGLFAELLPRPEDELAWVATAAGTVVGFLQVRERIYSGAGSEDWRALRRHLSLRRAVRAWLFLAVFHSASIPADELLIDVVAVHPRAQGHGVGSALVEFALDEARRRGKARAMLYCIAGNRRARDLYARAGFDQIHLERLWYVRWLLGFADSYLMRAPVRHQA